MSAGATGRGRPVPSQPAPPPTEATPRDGSGVVDDRGLFRATTVLADRMAAALVHREPGWRLPRRSALARRYNVSLTEIDAALGDLARRSLVRRLPDGQLYRASPADYWIPVEGATGLGTRLDPMGGAITCQTRHVSRREAPQDVAWALRLPSGAPIRVVRCVWVSAGDPAAVSTAYLNEPPGDEDPEAGQGEEQPVPSLGSVLNALPAAAVSVEMSAPQPSIARSLRLSPGQPVITVTVRFDDAATGEPAGLTVVVLRPELFRVAIDTTEAPAGTPLAAPAGGLLGWLPHRPVQLITGSSVTHGPNGNQLSGSRSHGCPRRGVPAWTYARRTWDAGTRDAGRGRDRGGIDATACPIPRPQGTAPP